MKLQRMTAEKNRTGSQKPEKDWMHLRKKDLLAALILLTVAILAYFLINFVVMKQGRIVRILVDGQVQQELPLSVNTQLDVEGYAGGSNHIVIQDGKVAVTDADCPDKICVQSGRISKTGETIVCLPHRIVVEIVGAQAGDEVDSSVR